jgi:hypothetical protein
MESSPNSIDMTQINIAQRRLAWENQIKDGSS